MSEHHLLGTPAQENAPWKKLPGSQDTRQHPTQDNAYTMHGQDGMIPKKHVQCTNSTRSRHYCDKTTQYTANVFTEETAKNSCKLRPHRACKGDATTEQERRFVAYNEQFANMTATQGNGKRERLE
eukprot:TRINITY_DN10339_c1_g1_i1.p2 TRINITY_DN10339_c1_g1~~TRINITY_DN10339_c1_g1_i1.p2  ORF type:complete len:126 (+),score=5.75 TRINITY_DN10339_c1_g1_i1:224-601(+)